MHLEGARSLAEYQDDFYAGTPVLTENVFGKGKAYYMGTRSSLEFYRQFLKERLEEKEIYPVLETPDGVEVTERFRGETSIQFILNHNSGNVKFKVKDRRKDLLTDEIYEPGTEADMDGKAVLILEKLKEH